MKQIYLNEYNLESGDSVFLPYSTGILQAYAQKSKVIRDEYEFKPIIFRKDTVENIVAQYDNPDIVGFSTVVWNLELSLEVAHCLKRKFPNCLIVFGGPAVDKQFTHKHSEVDIAVYGEGEIVFTRILINRLSDINIFHNKTLIGAFQHQNLDIFPSPYTVGIYDKLLEDNPEIKFKALVECNRNCPFGCAYCFWGQPELDKKIKYHSPQYIQADAKWIAKHNIDYVFCTDANFGMFKRDIHTASIYTETKKRFGLPEKFRVCYGKNAKDSIFETACILNQANMDKLITLSVQSTNEKTLKAIGRKNISYNAFKNLQKRYIDANISTYTEFILGLPCETKKSFLNGLESTLRTIGHNQIFVYPCLVLPNTRLYTQEYRKEYGLITKKVQMKVPHSNITNKEWVQEFDEVVVGTNTMSVEDWKGCILISWLIELFHSLNVGRDIVRYIHQNYHFSYIEIYTQIAKSNLDIVCELRSQTDFIASGKDHWSMTYPIYGDIYYEPEEMMYLHILFDKTHFYQQLWRFLKKWLNLNIKIQDDKLVDIFLKQQQNLPDTTDIKDWASFAFNTIICGGKDNSINKNV